MKPQTFWRAVIGTFTSARYYQDILRAPVWFSVRFFIISMVVLGMSRAVYVQFKQVPAWKAQASAIISQVERDFPTDLEITWDGQFLTNNLHQNLTLPYPEAVQPITEFWPPVLAYLVPQSLTPSEFTPQLPQRGFAVLTRDKLYVSDNQGQWTDLPLSATPGFGKPFTLSRQTLPAHLDTVRSYLTEFWAWASWALVGFSATYVLLGGFWISLFEGFFAFFVMRLGGFRLPFKKAWQLSLHLIVVAEALSQLILWLYGPVELPIFSLTFWALFAYVVLSFRSTLLPPKAQ